LTAIGLHFAPTFLVRPAIARPNGSPRFPAADAEIPDAGTRPAPRS
jgi:hypothetical protein